MSGTPGERDRQGPAFSEVFAADARDAVRELQVALSFVDITLPGLDVEPWVHPVSAAPLIELGGVRPAVATQLAAVLRRSAAPMSTPAPLSEEPDVETADDRPTLTELVQRADELRERVKKHLNKRCHGDAHR